VIDPKNFSPASADLGLGDILKDQLAIQTEEARKAALKKSGANDAQLAMSPASRSLFNFINGGTSDDLLS
jgi:hypothetical protein